MFGLVQELSRCDHIGSRGHHELFESMQMNRLLWEFCGNKPCFCCSVVTNATGVPRAVLVRSVTYKCAENLWTICKPEVICSNQIAGITLIIRYSHK